MNIITGSAGGAIYYWSACNVSMTSNFFSKTKTSPSQTKTTKVFKQSPNRQKQQQKQQYKNHYSKIIETHYD